jgi:hypothetical protein
MSAHAASFALIPERAARRDVPIGAHAASFALIPERAARRVVE